MDKKTIQQQTSRQVEYDDAQVEALFERLRAFLRRNLRKILKGIERGDVTAREAARMLGGLQATLDDAGLGERLGEIRGLFEKEFEAVNAEFLATTGRAALLSKFARQNLDAIVDDRLRMAGKTVEQYVSDIRTVITDSIIAGRSIDPSDVLDVAEGRLFHDIKTEIRTTLIAYNRIAHVEKAKKAGITKFLYVGPLDDVTRPFCEPKVDRIFTLEEIESWDNGTDLPANIYCGGYNCRHHLRPVSDDLAEELQAETSPVDETSPDD